MRRKEAYHEKILNPKEVTVEHAPVGDDEDEIATIHHSGEAVDEALKAELIYDWHPKHSFIDHFSPNVYEYDRFKAASFHEVGDFANQPFELDEKTHTFSREGGIYLDKTYSTIVTKQYRFSDDAITLDLTCKSDYQGKLHYGAEFNFHLAHPHLATLNAKEMREGLSFSAIESLEIVDTFTQKKLTLSMSEKCDLCAYTLKTVSQSESGFDTVSQQISLIVSCPFVSELALTLELGVSNV